VEKIYNMLRDLWAASEKPEFVFSHQVNLRHVVDEALRKLQDGFAAKNIATDNRIPDSLPVLTVDKPKFQRLFELLLRDEIVSLPAGAQVTISAQVTPGSRPGQSMVEVQVRDNGPGLPQEALRLIFDPFVVRSDSPLEYGISLMACYFIVHHHGGRIEAHSDAGRGTTFTLHFPLDCNQPTPMEDERDFLQKVLLNETLLEKLLTSD
jgi:signal transduction histidine kinase